MEISLAVTVFGWIGLLISFANGFGAGVKFLLFYVVCAAILGWVLTVMARRQQELLVGGTSVQFVFPAGTYWRITNIAAQDLRMTAHKDGTDHPPASGTTGASAVVATATGEPESGSIEPVTARALQDIATTHRGYIESNLLNVWQPQLSSKRPGLVAEGITWSSSDILREYMQLRERFPTARLVWSGDWPVFGDPTWWITVAGVGFPSGADANGWCAAQGFDADHCFAKILSHTIGSSGTTLGRK